MTVVFEILSPSNTATEMQEKQEFYDNYGVEEYYEYDPLTNRLSGFRRKGEVWERIRNFANWVSPRLGVRFQLAGNELVIETIDGQRFFTFEEAAQRWHDEKARAHIAEQRARRVAELGRKVRRGQATAEEIAELERLEQQLDSLSS